MLFHVRAKYGCTVFVDGDRIETLDTKTDRTISALVYPSWHPSGKFVAFSINNTTQDTHPVHRTEVYDKASDVVVYDVENRKSSRLKHYSQRNILKHSRLFHRMENNFTSVPPRH